MNQESFDDLRAIRAEQEILRARLEQLDGRLARFERGEPSAPPQVDAPSAMAAPAPVAAAPLPFPDPPPLPPAAAAMPGVSRESMEERIGTAWLVRVGVVLLLTSLAFLGDYLYNNIVPRLGPVSKVGLMYLGAGRAGGSGRMVGAQPGGTGKSQGAQLRPRGPRRWVGGRVLRHLRRALTIRICR